MAKCEDTHGYLRKSAYEGEEGEGGEEREEPTVLLDSAATRLVKTIFTEILFTVHDL